MLLSNRRDIFQRVCEMRYADTAGIALPYAGNHQLSDVHAALAMDRLVRADEERQARLQLVEQYDEWLVPLDSEPVRRETTGNQYRYIVRVEDAEKVIANFHSHGIGAARPVETSLDALTGDVLSGAASAWRHCVSIPVLADMTAGERTKMEKGFKSCL